LKKPRRGFDEQQCGREEMSDDKHDGAVASGRSIHFRAGTAVVQQKDLSSPPAGGSAVAVYSRLPGTV
jgi:hypothetical protein